MSAYYNEIDPYAAAWLRNLIAAGHLPAGDVDDRSIEDVRPDELAGYDQCHFFAGIGGWPYALRLAGWPDEWPVWTGSCPCQPFSAAGKRKGTTDERRLWPAFHWLIQQRRPLVVFGEQVASRDGLAWLDIVSTDLEADGYTCGAVNLPACGVGAPHIRQRLWWVADSGCTGLAGWAQQPTREEHQAAERSGDAGGLADSNIFRCSGRGEDGGRKKRDELKRSAVSFGLGFAHSAGLQQGREAAAALGYGNTAYATSERDKSRTINGFWRDADWLRCRDEKWRPVEPGSFPLASGIPSRVGKLRAYGNAIVPQAGAAFIAAYMDAMGATV